MWGCIIKMNNKGEKLISVYWFVILILVAGGIVAMVYIFYGAQYDIREIEGTIMNNKIADCISYKGKINNNIFEKDYQNNFLDNCHLTFDTEKDWEELQYYFDVDVFNLDETLVTSFNEGNKNLITSCEIKNEDYEKLPRCVEGRFYSVGENNEQYLIKILSIVWKSEKNIKQ